MSGKERAGNAVQYFKLKLGEGEKYLKKNEKGVKQTQVMKE